MGAAAKTALLTHIDRREEPGIFTGVLKAVPCLPSRHPAASAASALHADARALEGRSRLHSLCVPCTTILSGQLASRALGKGPAQPKPAAVQINADARLDSPEQGRRWAAMGLRALVCHVQEQPALPDDQALQTLCRS